MAQVQQQPYGQNDLLTSIHDDYLLQRHQQLLMQEQMQQRMQQRIIAEGLAQAGSQEQNYGAAAAYLEQEALRNAALATDEALIEQRRIFQGETHDLSSAQSETNAAPPPAVENPSSTPHVKPDTDSKESDKVESTTEYTAKKKTSSKPAAANKNVPAHSSAERERLLLMAKSLASQKQSSIAPSSDTAKSENDIQGARTDESVEAQKKRKSREEVAVEGVDPSISPKESQGKKRKSSKPGKEKKPIQEITKSGKLDGRTKKARELKRLALAEQRMLNDQEQPIANFLGGKDTDGNTSVKAGSVKKDRKKKDIKRRSNETDDDFAAKIVLTFKATTNIPTKELKVVNRWSQKGSHRQIDPPVSEKDYPQLTPHLKFNLPILPAEPEYTKKSTSKTKMNSLIEAMNSSGIVSAAESASILANLSQFKIPAYKTKSTLPNNWWPTADEIQQERKLLEADSTEERGTENVVGKSVSKNSFADAKTRLEKSVEPGVLEMLPYCQLREGLDQHVFCSQVADLHPNESMVCCSKCSTWRHIKCGGHYERHKGFRRSSNEVFEPVCDLCHHEQDLLEVANAKAVKRIELQRDDHLHRCNATNAVIQQFALSRHSHSKWPLGSVSPAHFAGHVKGVSARHEKGMQQWEEMITKLNCETQSAKDRVRTRTRALERILHSVEDAGELCSS